MSQRTVLVLAALLFAACDTSVPCGPSTCAGCCAADGVCVAEPNAQACGFAGGACQTCLVGQTCLAGSCALVASSGGAGGAGGSGGGGAAGAGGGSAGVGGTAGGGGTAGSGGAAGTAGAGGMGGACAGTLQACQGTCIDPAADESNCGGCGLVCGNGEVCNRSRCATLPMNCGETGCPPGFGCDPSTLRCTAGCQLVTDCPMGATCTSGQCVCGADTHACGQRCVSNRDVASCGASCSPCPTPANATATCDGARCGFTCNPGALLCQGQCVTCTAPANGTPTCSGAACDFTCNTGFHRCGNQCVSNTAVATCGASCTACPAPRGGTATCNGTTCGASCPASTHQCADTCVANAAVATCGTRCAPCSPPANASPTCDGVTCDFTCNPGTHRCGAQCLANTSPASCGTSCTACPLPAGAVATTCDGTSCGFTCPAGQHRCGMACVANTATATCGASCTPCTVPANGAATCDGTNCGFTCNQGYEPQGLGCALRWTWLSGDPTSGGGTIAGDSARNLVVFFRSDLSQAVTEIWDGGSWTRATPPTSPRPRINGAMAFDSTRGVTVLFGGRARPLDGGTTLEFLSDTWEYDGLTWTNRTPTARPGGRENAMMAFDPARACMVLFGGFVTGGTYGDTWEWNGTTWTNRTPSSSPADRQLGAMAYDPSRGGVVLIGGHNYTAGQRLFSDAWLWNGTAWLGAPGLPAAARWSHALAYDAQRARLVLFGGSDPFSSMDFNETWELDAAGTWTLRPPAMAPTVVPRLSATFDPVRRKVMVLAGSTAWWWQGP